MTEALTFERALCAYSNDYAEMLAEADPTYIEHWGAFYANAWSRVLAISGYHSVLAPLTVAKILAVTSPRMPWGRNLGVTDRIVGAWARWPNRAREEAVVWACLASIPNLGLFHSRKLAVTRAIIDPDCAPSGAKVSNFYRNITGDWSAVTIDTWMLKPLGITNVTKRAYDTAADAVTQLADEIGKPPAVVQAELWGWYRRDSGWQKFDPDRAVEA